MGKTEARQHGPGRGAGSMSVDWTRLAFGLGTAGHGGSASPFVQVEGSVDEGLASLNLLWDATAPEESVAASLGAVSRAVRPLLPGLTASPAADEAGLDAVALDFGTLPSAPERKMPPPSDEVSVVRLPLQEELPVARQLYQRCGEGLRELLGCARRGEPLRLETLEPLAESLLGSLSRCPDALLLLSQMQSRDRYTFQHLLSVGLLMMLFARSMGMEGDVVVQLGIGGLLHDIGKSRVPGRLLGAASLSRSERDELRLHVAHGCEMLQACPGVGRIPREIVAQHHERFDGSGYPLQLQGKEIGWYGQMAAIVDVYDSLIVGRGRRQGMAPTLALGRLLGDQGRCFHPGMVQSFIRAMGVYPTGSLVKLHSGRLAVVLEQNREERIKPRVQVIYHTRHRVALRPEVIDLRSSEDQIEGHESFGRWGLEPERYLPH